MFTFGPIQKKWLQSLEQHPERQMKKKLGIKFSDGTCQACCLGELGLIAGVCEWDERGVLTTTGAHHRENTLSEVYDRVGLRDAVGSGSDLRTYSLANLNDRRMTWPEIAAEVRANPERYLVKSV